MFILHNIMMAALKNPLYSLIFRSVNKWKVGTNRSFCFLDNGSTPATNKKSLTNPLNEKLCQRSRLKALLFQDFLKLGDTEGNLQDMSC